MTIVIPGWLARFLEWLFPSKPPKPGKFGLSFSHYSGAPMHLVYDIVLPPATKPNVVAQEIAYTVKTGDVTAPTVNLKVDMTASPVVAPQVSLLPGDMISIAGTQTDASGNTSEPSDPFVFTATDNVPPPKPAQFGLKFNSYSA